MSRTVRDGALQGHHWGLPLLGQLLPPLPQQWLLLLSSSMWMWTLTLTSILMRGFEPFAAVGFVAVVNFDYVQFCSLFDWLLLRDEKRLKFD